MSAPSFLISAQIILRSCCAPVICLILLCGGVGCSGAPPDTLYEPVSLTVLQKGKGLVHGIAACGFCHGARPEPGSILSGGQPYWDAYGQVNAPNLVPNEGGTAGWSMFEVMRAIRGSRRADGTQMSPTAHRGYEWMSDDDAQAIVAYIRALPTVGDETPRRDISFLDRNTIGFLTSPAREVRGYIPPIDPSFQSEYGAYLVDHVARCTACHNTPGSLFSEEEYLGGGLVVKTAAGERAAPGISSDTVAGVGAWSAAQIVAYLRTGVTPDGRQIDPNFCPTGFYRMADERDLTAIAAHLRRVRR